MNWTKDNKDYIPSKNVKGIIYRMEYNNKFYYGKKVIITPKGKESDYKRYYGSSTHWKEYIKGNEDKVLREVIYECRNKSEMYYMECSIIIMTNALFDEDCYNRNLGMVTTRAHTKNFINKPSKPI